MDFDLDLYYQSAVFPGFGEPTLEETEAATKAALEAELRSMRASFASTSSMEHHDLFMDPSAAWDFGSNVNANRHNTVSNTTSSSACSTPSHHHSHNEIVIKAEPTDCSSLPPDSPQKKRRQPWGRQLTPPTTNLPPRKRAKTDAEKQQRAYERVIRNRKAAETSRQRKQAQQDQLYRDLQAALDENKALKAKIGAIEKECTTYKTRSAHLQLQLQGIPNGSTTMSAAFKVEDPVAPIKLEVAAADHYVSPAALTCESPINQFDEIVSPTSSLAGSPETMSEDESPRTPTELKSGVYSHMFSHYAAYPSDSILLPSASVSAEPRKMANVMDINEHFNDVFTALNYDRNSEATQINDYVQNLF